MFVNCKVKRLERNGTQHNQRKIKTEACLVSTVKYSHTHKEEAAITFLHCFSPRMQERRSKDKYNNKIYNNKQKRFFSTLYYSWENDCYVQLKYVNKKCTSAVLIFILINSIV